LPNEQNSASQWSGQWDWLFRENLTLTTKIGSQYRLANLEKKHSYTGDLQFAPNDKLKFKFNFQQQASYENYLPSFERKGDEGFFAPGGRRDRQVSAGWEWAARKFSLTSNFLLKSRPEGSEQSDNLSGKLLLSPTANLKFNLNHQRFDRQDKQLQEICLENDWSRPQRPLKLTLRSLRSSQATGEGSRQEINLAGGWQKSSWKINFSGSSRQQQGCWEGSAAGRNFAFKTEGQFAKFKLTWAREAFSPENPEAVAGITKSRFFAGYALSPATELYGLQSCDNSAPVTERQRLGLKRTWRKMALEIAAESQDSNAGERSWREVKMIWKNDPPAPPWVHNLAQQNFGQSVHYGHSFWGSREPGLSLLYRRGDDLGEANSGIRLVYQHFFDSLQIGLGREQNPCLSGEPLTLQKGARNFLEVGFPIKEQLIGRVWLARQEIDGSQGRGWAFSLGKGGEKSDWEGFFAVSALTGGSGNSYGMRYSRQIDQRDFLKLSACFNPNLPAGLTSDWRIDIAFSRPI